MATLLWRVDRSERAVTAIVDQGCDLEAALRLASKGACHLEDRMSDRIKRHRYANVLFGGGTIPTLLDQDQAKVRQMIRLVVSRASPDLYDAGSARLLWRELNQALKLGNMVALTEVAELAESSRATRKAGIDEDDLLKSARARLASITGTRSFGVQGIIGNPDGLETERAALRLEIARLAHVHAELELRFAGLGGGGTGSRIH